MKIGNKFIPLFALSAVALFGCSSNNPSTPSGGGGNVNPPEEQEEEKQEEEEEKPMFDDKQGYIKEINPRFEIANFKYGTEIPYARYNQQNGDSWHARSWKDVQPEYDYTPDAREDDLLYKSNSEWYDNEFDEECNYFDIFGNSALTGSGKVKADYMLYIKSIDGEREIDGYGLYPEKYTNYLDLSNYSKLFIKFSSTSSNNSDVKFNILMKNLNCEITNLFSYEGECYNGTIEIDISKIDKSLRNKLEFIRFEQVIDDISTQVKIRNRVFSIKATADTVFNKKEFNIGGTTVTTKYLGNMLYTKWGAYSGSGFYDKTDKKVKYWYGAGLPETSSSDNNYYIESTDLNKGFTKPERYVTDNSNEFKLIDPSNKLKAYNEQIGYGGDPSVIKVNGVYYMYFSGLENGLDDGIRHHWNKVYCATSTDGKVFTVQSIPSNAKDGGAAGYGNGSPSAVYKDGVFYLYYYAQATEEAFPDEPTGVVVKTSTDGIHFNEAAIEISREIGAMDVKYIPSLRKWVGTYYIEDNNFYQGNRGGIHVVISDSPYEWDFDHTKEMLIAQNLDYPLNHNPGFIGDELGHGYENMFVTWGANDLPLTVNGYWFNAAQMDARQTEWSLISFK